MVNTGRPSSGCSRCRTRKIKCDESRPGCQRCSKIGKQCPGYDRGDSPVVRSYGESAESQWPSTTPMINVGPATLKIAYDSSSNSRSPELDARSLNADSRLPENIERESIALFYRSFVGSEHRRSRGYSAQTYLEMLPTLRAQAGANSCLDESVKAIALANWANRRRPVDYRSLLRAQYVRALKAVNESLSHPREGCSDATLMAIQLLGNFEILTGDCMLSRLPEYAWQAHTNGTMKILSAADPSRFMTPEGRRFFLLLHVPHQLKALLFSEELPEFHKRITLRVWKDEYGFPNTSTKLLNYFNEVIRVRAAMKKVLSRDSSTAERLCSEVIAVMNASSALEQGMAGWANAESWKPRSVRAGALSTSTPASYAFTARTYFTSYPIYLHWFRYFLARLKLYESLIEGLLRITQSGGFSAFSKRLGRDAYAQLCAYEDIVRWALDGFLGSIAFSLGDISEQGQVRSGNPDRDWTNGLPDVNCMSAIRLLVALHDLRGNEYLSTEQRAAVDGVFRRISMEMRLPWALEGQVGLAGESATARPGRHG